MGRARPGQWITSYANSGHSYLVVAGLRFDTGYNNAGSGPRWSEKMRPDGGYTVRHPQGSSSTRDARDGPFSTTARRRGAQIEQRDQQAEHADDHENDPDGGDVDAGEIGVDGERQDRPDGDQKE